MVLVLILVLIILILILVLLLLLLLLLHQFVTGIDVILLGLKISGILQEALLEGVYCRFPVFLCYCHVPAVEACGGIGILYAIQHLGGFVKAFLAVKVVCQVVFGRYGGCVFEKALAIAYIGLPIFPFAELTVALPEVHFLTPGAYRRQREQYYKY